MTAEIVGYGFGTINVGLLLWIVYKLGSIEAGLRNLKRRVDTVERVKNGIFERPAV